MEVVSNNTFIEQPVSLLVLRLVEAVGQAALAAVMAVKVARHEDACTALVCRTLTSQPVDFAVFIDLREEKIPSGLQTKKKYLKKASGHVPVLYLVVFKHSQFDLLPLVLVLLGGGVGLLLPFLGTTTQPQHQMERRLLQQDKTLFRRRTRPQQEQQIGDSSPSGCCSRTECVRPPAASRQRSASAGQEGYLQVVTAQSASKAVKTFCNFQLLTESASECSGDYWAKVQQHHHPMVN